MPLIVSPRHSPEDLEHWQRMARLDWLRGQDRRWPRREAKAMQVIRDFRPDYCGVSWGKDSVVVAHLCRRVDPGIPLVYMIDGEWENPDCRLVRDAFLADYPGAYFEYVTPPQLQTAPDGRVWPIWADFRVAKRAHGPRYVSGVRAQESRVRRMRAAKYGESSPNTCAPITYWQAEHVFAYLARHGLPIHPVYAMSRGGTLDRDWLRTSPLGGERGTELGRTEHEEHYYHDEMSRLTAERAK